ncbi:MAG: hypothetical protein KDH96_02380 [Candidatus Riesia sp.]|nr:hypothetical protein [Candidatus Riesia sp.]
MKKFCINIIDSIFDVIEVFMYRLFKIIDKCNLNRRIALWAGIILTIHVCIWCMGLVSAPPAAYTGVDVAAIIAAVLTPLSLLTGALMKFGEQYKSLRRATDDPINSSEKEST